MFIKREYPTALEECFQAPVEGAIYAEQIDKLRADGAVRPWIVDNSSLTHTCWDLGSPINTVVWYFQLLGADEIRVIDCDLDLDLTLVERVARVREETERAEARRLQPSQSCMQAAINTGPLSLRRCSGTP